MMSLCRIDFTKKIPHIISTLRDLCVQDEMTHKELSGSYNTIL